MAIALTANGLEIDSLDENLATMETQLHEGVSPGLDLSSTTILGQLLGVFANQIQQVKEAAQLEYASLDPNQASGDALTRLTRLVGVERNPATYSRVVTELTLLAGTYPAGTLVASVTGDPDARFANIAEITAAVDGVYIADMEAQAPGPVRANANTLTTIPEPVIGFQDVNNPEDAVLGLTSETDTDLRARWRAQLSRAGSGTVDAIRADVLQVATTATVIENDTSSTSVEGLPPHSFEVMVTGGVDADIAEAIFSTKPAGIQAYGSTTVTVLDAQGNGHVIGFSRPESVDVWLDINISYLQGSYIGDDQTKLLLVDWGDKNLQPGHDLIHARLVTLLMAQNGTVDVTVRLGLAPAPVGQVNVPMAARQVADLDTGRITITSTALNGVP